MTENNRGKTRSAGRTSLLEAFKEICAETGLKVTHQRLEIFRILAQAKDHPSVEAVFEKVKKKVPTIALDTVYRTLTTLEEHGVLGKLELEMRARYDPNTEVHHHFICTECKKIEDFYWPVFDGMKLPASKSPWGRVSSKRVEVRGICPACLKRKKKSG